MQEDKRHLQDSIPPPTTDQFIADQDAADSAAEDEDDSDKPKDKKAGRRKIKIEFIQDKSRRHITFSKRKAGQYLFLPTRLPPPHLAYELSTLTGTQVLLLVVSETGLVYTFTTAKLQPLVTQPEGKNLIQACLNAPHGTLPSSMPVGQPIGRSPSTPMGAPSHSNVPGGLSIGGQKEEDADADGDDERVGSKRRRRSSTAGGSRSGRSGSGAGQPPSPHSPAQGVPPSLSIPQHPIPGPHSGHPSQTPQIGLGPSPTTTSPAQQPTSPHYSHQSPTQPYHGSGQEMYPQTTGMMPPPGTAYPFSQPSQSTQGHWAGTVQGNTQHYGRR
ncbi:hypothetical protein OF83DRAFT_1162356 [Amylostereum chailletii]|nr:hypothetical protein OF83DRAFT_1162356 [Amylostereum chailletii]